MEKVPMTTSGHVWLQEEIKRREARMVATADEPEADDSNNSDSERSSRC